MGKVIQFRKLPQGILVPEDEYAAAAMKRWKNDAFIEGEFTEKRNGGFHRKFRKMCSRIFERQEYCRELDDFIDILKFAGGHFHWIDLPNQTRIPKVDSLSFANVDQLGFEKIVNSIITALLERTSEICPGMTEEELYAIQDEVLTFA